MNRKTNRETEHSVNKSAVQIFGFRELSSLE